MADDPQAPGTTGPAADESVADANRRRLREALERKKGVQHPDDAVRGTGVGSGHGPAAPRREFRRKSG